MEYIVFCCNFKISISFLLQLKKNYSKKPKFGCSSAAKNQLFEQILDGLTAKNQLYEKIFDKLTAKNQLFEKTFAELTAKNQLQVIIFDGLAAKNQL